jgi:hypothetical protein
MSAFFPAHPSPNDKNTHNYKKMPKIQATRGLNPSLQ